MIMTEKDLETTFSGIWDWDWNTDGTFCSFEGLIDYAWRHVTNLNELMEQKNRNEIIMEYLSSNGQNPINWGFGK